MRGSNSGMGMRYFSFPETCTLTLGPTSYSKGTGGFFFWGKVTGAWMGLSAPSNAKVKNEWSYTSTPPIFLHGVESDNLNFSLYFIRRTEQIWCIVIIIILTDYRYITCDEICNSGRRRIKTRKTRSYRGILYCVICITVHLKCKQLANDLQVWYSVILWYFILDTLYYAWLLLLIISC